MPWYNLVASQPSGIGVLTPSEALGMDTKIDDGKPGRGAVRAWRTGGYANCTTTDTTQDAQAYNVSFTNFPACALIFLPGF